MTTLHTQRHFQRITWFGSGVSLTSRLLPESSRSLVGGELLPAPATHRDGRGQMPGGREAATPSFLPAPSTALCGAGQRLPAGAGTASPSPVARGCAGRDGTVPQGETGRAAVPTLGRGEGAASGAAQGPAAESSPSPAQGTPPRAAGHRAWGRKTADSALLSLFPARAVCFTHRLTPLIAAYATAALKRHSKALFLRQT